MSSAFPGLLRLIPGQHMWVYDCRVAREHLGLCMVLPYGEVSLNGAGLEAGGTGSEPFYGGNEK